MTFFCLIFIFQSFTFSQEIPNTFFSYKKEIFDYNIGKNWHKNTTLGAPRFDNYRKKMDLDSLQIDYRIGFYNLNQSIALYGFGQFFYKNNFYGYLYPRIVNDVNFLIGYSGIPRDIKRGGFSSGETDLSGIGYQNNWFFFQIGRGRENWGSGNGIELALTNNSPSYDYLAIGSNYGKLNVKYFHGFLENYNGYNRYIIGRGIEWLNKKNLLIGISEIIIYSGINRSIDLGYLNPLGSHLETELNNRLNITGTESANAVWQIALDYLFNNKIRFSSNFLIDEFVLDKIEKDKGKEHGKAFSSKIVYSPIYQNGHLLNIFISFIHVGTPTFRHSMGMNNFIQRNKPLGWGLGSDSDEIIIGLNYLKNNDFLVEFNLGKRRSGIENILERAYEPFSDYLYGTFPSGETNEITFIGLKYNYFISNKISFFGEFNCNMSKGEKEYSFKLGTDMYLFNTIKL